MHYINIITSGNKIYHKYVLNGKRYDEIVDFEPSLYFRDEGGRETSFHSLVHGYPLKRKTYSSLSEYYNAVKRYKELGGLLYGDVAPHYQFIASKYFDVTGSSIKNMRVIYLDIETAFEPGIFPEPESADYEVLTITIYDTSEGIYRVLGYKDIEDTSILENAVDGEVVFERLEDEEDLLIRFMDLWIDNLYPDMVVGWNSDKFDIPYLYQRINKLFGREVKSKLSPIGRTMSRMRVEEVKPGWYQEYLDVTVMGVNCIDLMKFYKKNVLDAVRSYSLDDVSYKELKATKQKHPYKNLMDLYEKDYPLFCRYNLLDVDLMVRINHRRRLLELIIQQAYMAGVNFEDTFYPNKRWDCKLFKHLMTQDTIVEPKMDHDVRPAGHGVSEVKLKKFLKERDEVLDHAYYEC